MVATVLLVEDERKLRDLVRSYLERAGFTVLSTGSGAEALTLAASGSPDLVVLDLGLPDIPGETVARELRATGGVPVLMLTAKSSEEDRIRGLELGADDYVTKPFSPRELVLRVQAILRRGHGGPAAEQGVTSYGDDELVVDEPRRTVVVRGASVDLTPTEWGLLVALARAGLDVRVIHLVRDGGQGAAGRGRRPGADAHRQEQRGGPDTREIGRASCRERV